MGRSSARLGQLAPWLPWVAAIIGAGVVMAAFFPGYMSPDSLDQLSQAKSGVYGLWHPPVMAWGWRQVDRIVPGPAGMLVLQAGFFFAALALLFGRLCRPLAAALLVLIVGLFPPVFALLGTIWKDVQMGVAALLGFALVFRFSQGRRWGWLFASAIPLFWVSAVRMNGASAGMPIAIWAAWLVRDRLPFRSSRGRLWGSLAAGAIAGIALFALALAANASLSSDRGRSFPEQVTYLDDLIAISRAEGESLFPAYLREDPSSPTLEDIRRLPAHDEILPLVWGGGRRFRLTSDPLEVESLRKSWIAAIRRDPVFYLRHRMFIVRHLLALGVENRRLFPGGIDSNRWGIRPSDSLIHRAGAAFLGVTAHSIFFRPWAYFLVMALAFGLMAVRRLSKERRATLWALAGSGLGYALPGLALVPAEDFRYLWWTVIAALVCAVFAGAPEDGPESTVTVAAVEGG